MRLSQQNCCFPLPSFAAALCTQVKLIKCEDYILINLTLSLKELSLAASGARGARRHRGNGTEPGRAPGHGPAARRCCPLRAAPGTAAAPSGGGARARVNRTEPNRTGTNRTGPDRRAANRSNTRDFAFLLLEHTGPN